MIWTPRKKLYLPSKYCQRGFIRSVGPTLDPGGGGEGGWTVDTEAEDYLDNNELAGAITQFPYHDMFESDPSARVVEGGDGTVTWDDDGGWDGAGCIIIQPHMTAGQRSVGFQGTKEMPNTRLLSISWCCRWNDNIVASSLHEVKWIMAFINAPGSALEAFDGLYRLNLQMLNHSGIGGASRMGLLPMPGVGWPQMPRQTGPDLYDTNEGNADQWWHWEIILDLDTGIYAWIVTPEGGTPAVGAAYNCYDPPDQLEANSPPATMPLTVFENPASWVFRGLGGPSGYPYWGNGTESQFWPAGSEFRISHKRVHNAYSGPPDGFAASYDMPTIIGTDYSAYDPNGFSTGLTVQEYQP